MTVVATKPDDQELVSMLPYWIRHTRAALNALIANVSDITVNNLSLTPGDIAIVVGTELTAIGIEVVFIDCLGVSVIEQIRGGSEGQIKIFVFQGNNVGFKDGPKLTGQLYLNQLPALSTFDAQTDDVIALVNIGGDGAAVYGYWKELWRQVSVK
jgi:hypothetical protein